MAQLEKAKVFMSGRSQAVRIPAEFRFTSKEVYIRRDARNGDVILSQSPGSLKEILDALDQLGVPDDFLSPSERAPAQRTTPGKTRTVTLLYLLDTNMVSYIVRRSLSRRQRVRLLALKDGEDEARLSTVITVAEIRYGSGSKKT